MPTQRELAELLSTLEAAVSRKRDRALDFFKPSPKQFEFLKTTAEPGVSEVALFAGNQNGKSHCGAFHDACHLTGDYPKWWPGRKFSKPITAWVCGVKGTDVRDTMQAKLCGDPPGVEEMFGTGFIPREAFAGRPSMMRGVTDMYDTVSVKHLAPGGGGTIDGISTLRFKTYPEERRGFQGKPVDLVHVDEEPHDWGIYEEIQARTIATQGLIIVTLTPKMGKTNLYLHFDQARAEHIRLVRMGVNDVTHLSAEEKEKVLAKFASARDREAILYGYAVVGEGRVFTMPLESILEPYIAQPPLHWRKIWGVDFGIDHPFAASLLGWDQDTDTIHVLRCVRMAGGTPLHHVPAIRAVAAAVPVAWPHDGHKRDAGSGVVLAQHYRKPGPGMQGLAMLGTHATWPEGGFYFMPGIDEMNLRMETGRFKVGNDLTAWHDEYQDYQYKDGQVVKIKDDLLSATRVGLMMKRYAKPLPLGASSGAARRPSGMAETARDVNFDLF